MRHHAWHFFSLNVGFLNPHCDHMHIHIPFHFCVSQERGREKPLSGTLAPLWDCDLPCLGKSGQAVGKHACCTYMRDRLIASQGDRDTQKKDHFSSSLCWNVATSRVGSSRADLL